MKSSLPQWRRVFWSLQDASDLNAVHPVCGASLHNSDTRQSADIMREAVAFQEVEEPEDQELRPLRPCGRPPAADWELRDDIATDVAEDKARII